MVLPVYCQSKPQLHCYGNYNYNHFYLRSAQFSTAEQLVSLSCRLVGCSGCWLHLSPISKWSTYHFVLALGPPGRSHTQHFNSETERVAQKLFSSKLQPNLTCRALHSLETSLCMVTGIHHAFLLPKPDSAVCPGAGRLC